MDFRILDNKYITGVEQRKKTHDRVHSRSIQRSKFWNRILRNRIAHLKQA